MAPPRLTQSAALSPSGPALAALLRAAPSARLLTPARQPPSTLPVECSKGENKTGWWSTVPPVLQYTNHHALPSSSSHGSSHGGGRRQGGHSRGGERWSVVTSNDMGRTSNGRASDERPADFISDWSLDPQRVVTTSWPSASILDPAALGEPTSLPMGTIIRSTNPAKHVYRLVSKLGEGAHGVVYGVVDEETNAKFALKVQVSPTPDQWEKEMFEHEAEVMEGNRHEGLVALREHFTTLRKVGGFPRAVLVMDWCEGVTLANWVESRAELQQPLSEQEVLQPLVQLMQSVESLHAREVAHSDIKSENVYVDIDRGNIGSIDIRLGDFGNSRNTALCRATAGSCATFAGTPSVMAPELLRREEYTPQASDVWAVGMVAYELCTMEKFFSSETLLGLYQEHAQMDVPQRLGMVAKAYGGEMADLVGRMLCVEAEKRARLNELLELPIVHRHLQAVMRNATGRYEPDYFI